MAIWLANAVTTMIVVFGSMPIVTSIGLVFFGLAGAAIHAHELWELRKK